MATRDTKKCSTSLVRARKRKPPYDITMHLSKWLKIKTVIRPNLGEKSEMGLLVIVERIVKTAQSFWEAIWQFRIDPDTQLPRNFAAVFLNVYPEKFYSLKTITTNICHSCPVLTACNI